MKISSLLLGFFAIMLFAVVPLSGEAQNTLTLDKQGKVKRLHFFQNDNIRVKLITGEKVGGTIEYIYDTAFVINGRVIQPAEVYEVYTSRKAFKWIGGLLVTGGLFYTGIEMANNLINDRGYLISDVVAVPLAVTLGTGGALLLFSTRKTKVAGTNKFKILNTTPIPIRETATQDSTSWTCPQTLTGTLRTENLDGCSWIIETPDGKQFEPLNLTDFIAKEELDPNRAFKIEFDYEEQPAASVCMIGPTIVIKCLKVLP